MILSVCWLAGKSCPFAPIGFRVSLSDGFWHQHVNKSAAIRQLLSITLNKCLTKRAYIITKIADNASSCVKLDENEIGSNFISGNTNLLWPERIPWKPRALKVFTLCLISQSEKIKLLKIDHTFNKNITKQAATKYDHYHICRFEVH